MRLLGNFKYHIYNVKLEAHGDETEYKITLVVQSTTSLRNPDYKDIPQIETFDDLRIARDRFENIVHDVIFRTSFTDVSIYQQQYAQPSI